MLKALVALVLGLGSAATAAAQTRAPFQPRALSAFDRSKAAALVQNRLPCLGCHSLNGTGGRIGPSLSDLAARRSPDYVYAMITDPQGTVPGTIMPRVPMSPGTLDLIAAFLLQGNAPPSPPAAVRPPTPTAPGPVATSPAALYVRFCGACHGTEGKGDGANAAFLPVKPTAHASAQTMSARPDDALFDTIFAGGYVMSRSNLMPPFGLTLTRDQIWALVRHIRSLCRCEGPAWSRDNR
ncbi:MAG: c-type cytochrome [Gemmatimonadetes bacterium]|nr:c-type cytochrome [Gemmatimonadota bacterium]